MTPVYANLDIIREENRRKNNVFISPVVRVCNAYVTRFVWDRGGMENVTTTLVEVQ